MIIKNAYQYNNFLKQYDLSLRDYIYAKRKKEYDEEGNLIPSSFDNERFNLVKELNSKNHKEMLARYKMRKAILARVEEYENPYFVTITFRDNALEKNYERNIKEMLKRYNIRKWCFVTDYGKENQRLHYHGFVDLKSVDMALFVRADSEKYSDGLNFVPMLNCFGFNLFTPLAGQLLTSTIAYCIKYATKDMENGLTFKHKMFCSRTTKEDKALKEMIERERQEEILDLLFS